MIQKLLSIFEYLRKQNTIPILNVSPLHAHGKSTDLKGLCHPGFLFFFEKEVNMKKIQNLIKQLERNDLKTITLLCSTIIGILIKGFENL